MGDTRVKITYSNGTTFELEGTESFVEKHLESLKLNPNSLPQEPARSSTKQKQLVKSSSKGSKEKKKISFSPIPVNLKGSNNQPTLKKFFEEKKPRENQEIITLFAYYLNKYCNIPNMEFGHAVSCYIEMNLRKPTNIQSLCQNVRNRKAYLEIGTEPYTYKITIQGENLIEHDLPSKDNSKK